MRLRLLAFYFASCGASIVAAQPNPNPQARQAVESLPPIFAPRAPPKGATSAGATRPASPTPPLRAISLEMAAKLSAITAHVAPPANTTPTGGIAAAAPPGGSSDTVQLTPYIVQEDRLPELKERDILTPKGKLAIARRRYPGLGPLGDAAALRMLEEDFAKERRQEMADLQGLLELGGPSPRGT